MVYTLPFQKRNSGEIMYQSKIENKLDRLQILHLCVWCQSALQFSKSFQLCWLQHTSLFFLFPRLSYSTLSRCSINLASPTSEVFNTLQVSPSWLHAMTSLSRSPWKDIPDTCLASVRIIVVVMRYHDQIQDGEERVDPVQRHRSSSKETEDRNSSRAKTQRQELMQRLWRSEA